MIPRVIFSARQPETLIPMGDLLQHQATRAPERIALTFGEQQWRRDELALAAARRATRLADLGVKRNDRVIVTLPAGPEFHISCFAIWMLGATPVPLSDKLTAKEHSELVALSDASLVLGGDAADAGRVPGLTLTWTDDRALAPRAGPSPVADHWKVIGSGGSTGRPKLIVDARPAAFDPEVTSLAVEVDDVVLCPAPVYHNAPFSVTNWGLAWGAHVIEMARFDPVETLRLIERHKVRWLYLVPTMMARIWDLPAEQRSAFDLSSLEAVVHMAAPCPAWLKRGWIDWLGADRIIEIYAGTEAIGACTVTGAEWLKHQGSVGRPLRPGSIRILDDERQPVEPGTIGAIWFRRDQSRSFQYIGADAAALDGWDTYGDMGSLDADGFLYLADRRSDMFVSGGVNIWPAEIESALESIDGIRSAVVVGLPDRDFGARGHAIVEPAPGVVLSPADIREALAERLAPAKLPRTIELVDKPLRDEAGKVRRTAMRDDRIRRQDAGERFTPLK